jgi:Uma2 family endonuclease
LYGKSARCFERNLVRKYIIGEYRNFRKSIFYQMSKFEEPQSDYNRLPKHISLEEYLVMIDDGTRRLEYHDGTVVDIKSASEAHGLICTNLTGLLYNCLKKTNCRLFAGDRELWVKKCNKMFYPDILITCGEHQKKQMSKNVEATLNPSVVIEVLSISTQNMDLGPKNKCYKTIESLKEIIIIWQNMVFISKKYKNEKGEWIDIDYTAEDEYITINGCQISINDIYDDVNMVDIPQHNTDTPY